MVELARAWPALAAVAIAAALAVASPGPQAAPAAPAPPPKMPPPDLPAPVAPVAPAPAASAEGLVLYGISGGGPAGLAAIIGPASGSARVVPAGSEYRPGLEVREIGLTYAILAGAGQETRLDLNGTARGAAPSPADAAAAASPADFAGMDAIDLRLGTSARRQAGRITGFQLKHGADLPVLRKAGLRPGDVIVAVNGQAFESEEKLIELPREIAGSYSAEFEFERSGRRMKTTLPVNARPER